MDAGYTWGQSIERVEVSEGVDERFKSVAVTRDLSSLWSIDSISASRNAPGDAPGASALRAGPGLVGENGSFSASKAIESAVLDGEEGGEEGAPGEGQGPNSSRRKPSEMTDEDVLSGVKVQYAMGLKPCDMPLLPSIAEATKVPAPVIPGSSTLLVRSFLEQRTLTKSERQILAVSEMDYARFCKDRSTMQDRFSVLDERDPELIAAEEGIGNQILKKRAEMDRLAREAEEAALKDEEEGSSRKNRRRSTRRQTRARSNSSRRTLAPSLTKSSIAEESEGGDVLSEDAEATAGQQGIEQKGDALDEDGGVEGKVQNNNESKGENEEVEQGRDLGVGSFWDSGTALALDAKAAAAQEAEVEAAQDCAEEKVLEEIIKEELIGAEAIAQGVDLLAATMGGGGGVGGAGIAAPTAANEGKPSTAGQSSRAMAVGSARHAILANRAQTAQSGMAAPPMPRAGRGSGASGWFGGEANPRALADESVRREITTASTAEGSAKLQYKRAGISSPPGDRKAPLADTVLSRQRLSRQGSPVSFGNRPSTFEGSAPAPANGAGIPTTFTNALVAERMPFEVNPSVIDFGKGEKRGIWHIEIYGYIIMQTTSLTALRLSPNEKPPRERHFVAPSPSAMLEISPEGSGLGGEGQLSPKNHCITHYACTISPGCWRLGRFRQWVRDATLHIVSSFVCVVFLIPSSLHPSLFLQDVGANRG